MADGLGGAIENGAFNGSMTNDENLVKSPQRLSAYYLSECKGLIQPSQRNPDENYDIRIDDKGNATIVLTHFETNCFAQYFDDKNNTVEFSKDQKNSPVMATTRMVVTMVIKNAPDSELGEKIPEFEIKEIKQEVE